MMNDQSKIHTSGLTILTYPLPLPATLNRFLGMGLFVLLTALGAFIRLPLPFTPVPVTLQTLFVLLAGAFLGCGWGASAMGVYLLIGACGIPVFAGASCGLLYLLGPTGGYLLGFVVGAWIIGCVIGSSAAPSWRRILSGIIVAVLAIYALGITQLMLWGRWTLAQAIYLGFLPFLPGELLKIVAAFWIIKGMKRGFMRMPRNASDT